MMIVKGIKEGADGRQNDQRIMKTKLRIPRIMNESTTITELN